MKSPGALNGIAEKMVGDGRSAINRLGGEILKQKP
jgi:hypothetical protein